MKKLLGLTLDDAIDVPQAGLKKELFFNILKICEIN
jgi:hypothetical protein